MKENNIQKLQQKGEQSVRIVFFDLDTLRPDHLGCYGYFRNTSPNIDSIAREGVIFNRYYCPDAPCLPSRSALSSGMFGIHNVSLWRLGTVPAYEGDGLYFDVWSELMTMR